MNDLKHVLSKLKPMLATSSPPFDSKDYIFEVKWDGFRCLSYLGGSTVLQSRNRLDFTHKFPELEGLHHLIKKGPLVVDGEIIIMDGGIPSFYELQKRGWTRDTMSAAAQAAQKPATYVVFDVLYSGEDKLLNLPLLDRKEILRQVLASDERLFISEGVSERGIDFYRACIARDLEGVVAKKTDSTYMPGKRSPYWKKFKKAFEGEFIICGYKMSQAGSERVDGLLLGVIAEGGPVFQGTVGVGLAGLVGRELYKMLAVIRSETPLFKVPREAARGLVWVIPKYCCAVEFLEPARDGGLRHPVFRGLRMDLNPEDCTGIAGAIFRC